MENLETIPDAPLAPHRHSGPPKLRSASSALKHGLYAKDFVFVNSEDKNLYDILLHDFHEEYGPITSTEIGLVQQLAELEYRYLKIQKLQATAVRSEFLAQAKCAVVDPLGNPPTEAILENRAMMKLLDESPAFRLYLRELDRLPNRINRVVARLHVHLKLRPDLALWTHKPWPKHPPVEPEPLPAVEAVPMDVKTEEEAKQIETDLAQQSHQVGRGPGKENWPEVLKDRFEFYKVWDTLEERDKELAFYGKPNDYRRLAFFDMCGHGLDQMKIWLAQREC